MSSITSTASIDVPTTLIDAIRSFSPERVVEHCGTRWTVAAFEFYSDCPRCGARLKLRSFSACAEIEDVFDAVFEWMNQPGADILVQQRRDSLKADDT